MYESNILLVDSTSIDYTLEELGREAIIYDEDPLISQVNGHETVVCDETSQVNVTIGGPVTIFSNILTCCIPVSP